jgi:hypothetical protein
VNKNHPPIVENEEDVEETRVGALIYKVIEQHSSDKERAAGALFVAFGTLADKHGIPFRILRDMAEAIFGDAARQEDVGKSALTKDLPS